MRVRSFRKKPVVIEAVQWDGTSEEAVKITGWVNGQAGDSSHMHIPGVTNSIAISTREGDMHASEGDWVIKGVAGEFYPCKPDIFEQTYVPVSRG